MQSQQRDAGFLDFLKKRAPTQPQPNSLSRLLDSKTVEDFLRQKTHMDITGMEVEPMGFGVSITVTVAENNPVNRTRTLESAVAPVVDMVEDFLQAPVSAKVSLDLDNPLFDPYEGVVIYKILLKTTPMGDSARRVATKVMLLTSIG